MRTVVHLLRHGEVYNPQGILYGRASGFNLSDRGRAMAERVAERIGDRDITHIVSSPLERAQQTAGRREHQPASQRHDARAATWLKRSAPGIIADRRHQVRPTSFEPFHERTEAHCRRAAR